MQPGAGLGAPGGPGPRGEHGANPCLSSSLQEGCAPIAATLARPPPLWPQTAAGLPTHPGVEAPAASGGGAGKEVRRGVREGEEKGRGRLRLPMASGPEEGHLSSGP